MKIPLDFHYRILVEDLDTGQRVWFLVPRGTRTAVPAPPELAGELSSVIPVGEQPQEMEFLPDLSQQGDLPLSAQQPASLGPAFVPAGSDVQQKLSTAPGLVPGLVAGPASAKDAFGAEEG